MHTVVVFTRRSRHEAVLGAWLADAVRRGQKVLVLRAPEEDGSLLDRLLAAAALDPSGLAGSGQVEVLDTARWRAESGGEAAGLYELYLGQLRRAARDGFPGVAMSGDERALRVLVRDNVELIAHEHDIDRLVADQGVRALCRYPVGEGGGVLQEVLRLHCRDVVDDLWQATVVADRLLVRGEIEASNVDRFRRGGARGRDRRRIDSGPVRGGVLLRGGRARSIRCRRPAPAARQTTGPARSTGQSRQGTRPRVPRRASRR
jgi:hypothetical protein